MTLSIHNLHFAYRDRDILRGLNLELPAHSLVAILGKNGSGKTTLLKNINRMLKPQAGTVLIDGRAVAEMNGREIARHFGYMPQQQTVAHCNVLEAVLLGKKMCSDGNQGPEELDEIEEVLRLVHLEGMAMRSVVELSGGELQKVILARALAQKPKVLLLDEPINHLDLVNQIEVMSLLHAVTRDLGITAMVVTHNLDNALRFADRFILLKDGAVLAMGGEEIITPTTVRDAFQIDATIETIGGRKIVVPTLRGIRSHRHFDASGHSHEHMHGVIDHVYDHRHEQKATGNTDFTVSSGSLYSEANELSKEASEGGLPAERRGYVHVYTGDGKGKTTAAIGLALRAVGAGMRVFIAQFIKSMRYCEIESLASFHDQVITRQYGKGCWLREVPNEEDIRLARAGLVEVEEAITSGKYDLVILDEINVATWFKLIEVEELLRLIEVRPKPVELVFTGRRADPRLIERADLVTEMREIKHYYQVGVQARKGIES